MGWAKGITRGLSPVFHFVSVMKWGEVLPLTPLPGTLFLNPLPNRRTLTPLRPEPCMQVKLGVRETSLAAYSTASPTVKWRSKRKANDLILDTGKRFGRGLGGIWLTLTYEPGKAALSGALVEAGPPLFDVTLSSKCTAG